jgi:hypothetical protein
MSETQFEPEVLALLDEIARSPEGRLLHVPRQRLRSYYGDPSETLTPHGSYLSKAERHLVSAYREQAARVLLEACHARLQRDQQVVKTRDYVEGDLQGKARVLSRSMPVDPDLKKTLTSLGDRSELSATELVVASVRLAPSEAASNALAVCYQQEGWLRTSLRVLAPFFDCAASDAQRADALSNMGRAHFRPGEYHRAFEFSRQACLLDESRSRLAVWCLTDALQSGDEQAALAASRTLEERLQDGCVALALQVLVEGKKRGAWTPTAAGRNVSARIRVTLPPASGAVCEVFT